MKKLFNKILGAAKAVVGGTIGAIGIPPIVNEIAQNTVIWSWEYALASFFGVGISVYLIPNKGQVNVS